jgi:hypothetical protein
MTSPGISRFASKLAAFIGPVQAELTERWTEHRRTGGTIAATKAVLVLVGQKVLFPYYTLRRYGTEYLTDRRLGIDSRATALRPKRGPTGEYGYQPTRAVTFTDALRHLSLDSVTTGFVDLGAGKGTALVLAERAGFRSLIGVEYDADLVVAARRNVPGAEIVQADARTYVLPHGRVLAYLYCPFNADILVTVIDLADATRKTDDELWVLYTNPMHRSVLDEHSAFTAIGEGPDWAAYQWTRR